MIGGNAQRYNVYFVFIYIYLKALDIDSFENNSLTLFQLLLGVSQAGMNCAASIKIKSPSESYILHIF